MSKSEKDNEMVGRKLDSNSKVRHALGLLVTFVNVGSLFMVIPVSIKWRKGVGYQVHRVSKWRQVACCFCAFSCNFTEFFLLFQLFSSNKLGQRMPIQYFDLARRVSSFVFYGISWLMINYQIMYLESFINRIQWNFTFCYPGKSEAPLMQRTSQKIRLTFVAAIILFVHVHYVLISVSAFTHSTDWSISTWTEYWIEAFRRQYLLDRIPRTTAMDILSLVFGFFFVVAATNFQFFTLWLLLVGSIAIWTVVETTSAVSHFEASNSWKFKQVKPTSGALEYHELLKMTFGDFEKIFGLETFGVIVVSIPQLVFSLNEFMDPPSLPRFIRNFIRFSHFFTYVTLTVLTNSKTNVLGDWMLKPENYAALSYQQFNILQFEISTARIGIYAWKLFKVNSGAIGSVVNAIFIFSVITLQFQKTECEQK